MTEHDPIASQAASAAAIPDARLDLDTGPRGFAALHRDTWRIARKLPLLTLLLPAAIWFPFDLLAELVASATGDDVFAQISAYNRVDRITGFLVGTWVNALVLAAVFAFGRGVQVSASETFKTAGRFYGPVLHTTWSFSWRVGLATLLLVVPGIVLACRYAFALPITLREGLAGPDALAASTQQTEGHRLRIFGYVVAACSIYLLLALVPVMLLPVETSPVVDALTTIPFNIISALLTVAGALLYLDASGDQSLVRPVGRVGKDEVLSAAPETSSGTAGVVLAFVAGVVLFAGALGWSLMNEPDLDSLEVDSLEYELPVDVDEPADSEELLRLLENMAVEE